MLTDLFHKTAEETKMIYIVSGFMRSGTSMMMRCLEAGGLTVEYDKDREDHMQKDYPDGNPVFYEQTHESRIKNLSHAAHENGMVYGYADSCLGSEDLANKFTQQYEGKVIKVLEPWLWCLPRNANIEMIFMTRDPKEIRKSFNHMLGRDLGADWVAEYWTMVNDKVTELRESFPVTITDYNKFIRHPVFPEWGIDEAKAASVINKKWAA